MFHVSRFNGIERRQYECEIVTPMFLGGADPRSAELRVPPIKGLLRFWWRALNPTSYDILKKKEAAVFGDAGTEYGKSPLKMSATEGKLERGQYQPLPHHNDLPKNRSFPCFLPGSKISVTVWGRDEHHKLFKLFCLLGGIGKRSRRGFGCMRIKTIDHQPPSGKQAIDEIYELINALSGGEDNFRKTNNGIERSKWPPSSIRYPYLRRVEIGNKYKYMASLLETIGKASHEYKSDFTGYAKKNDRFASPIYVSTLKVGNEYHPLISSLNVAFRDDPSRHGVDNSKQFVEKIMRGAS